MKRIYTLLLALLISAGALHAQDCDSPPNSLSSALDSTTFQLSLGWAGADSAIKCEIQIQDDSATLFKRVRVNSNTGFTINAAGNLQPNTTYLWRVRCACSLPPDTLIVSPFSAVTSFTTPAAPRLGLASDVNIGELYPNPASDRLNLTFEADADVDVRVNVLDLTGRVLLEQSEQAFQGSNTFALDLGTLQPGQYLLRVEDMHSSRQQAFQIVR